MVRLGGGAIEEISATEKPTAAFVLSLVGGLFMLVGGAVTSAIGFYWFRGMMRGFGGRWGGMMGYPGFDMIGGLGFISGLLGVVFGAIVILSAIIMNSRPQQHTTWPWPARAG